MNQININLNDIDRAAIIDTLHKRLEKHHRYIGMYYIMMVPLLTSIVRDFITLDDATDGWCLKVAVLAIIAIYARQSLRQVRSIKILIDQTMRGMVQPAFLWLVNDSLYEEPPPKPPKVSLADRYIGWFTSRMVKP